MLDAETKRYIDQQIETLRREMRLSVCGQSSGSGPKTVAYAVSAGHATSADAASVANTASTAITASTAGYVQLTAGSENVHIINGTTISVDIPEPDEE